ncbi:Tensin-1 [Cyphomyrmex costatus]|uniref:Tensin-1 n=1 Tax=Cyphomyrmex costatus TaxID=456900 RepID=A0A195CWD3_9HYME|nr:Tensin-1 [Cyphomyrmex costatus]
MLRTFYATSFLSCVGILRHDSRDGAHENVNSYNVTTLEKNNLEFTYQNRCSIEWMIGVIANLHPKNLFFCIASNTEFFLSQYMGSFPVAIPDISSRAEFVRSQLEILDLLTPVVLNYHRLFCGSVVLVKTIESRMKPGRYVNCAQSSFYRSCTIRNEPTVPIKHLHNSGRREFRCYARANMIFVLKRIGKEFEDYHQEVFGASELGTYVNATRHRSKGNTKRLICRSFYYSPGLTFTRGSTSQTTDRVSTALTVFSPLSLSLSILPTGAFLPLESEDKPIEGRISHPTAGYGKQVGARSDAFRRKMYGVVKEEGTFLRLCTDVVIEKPSCRCPAASSKTFFTELGHLYLSHRPHALLCLPLRENEFKQCVQMAHALRRISYATCEPQYAQFSFLAREPRAHFSLQYCHSFITKSAEQEERASVLRPANTRGNIVSNVDILTTTESQDLKASFCCLEDNIARGFEVPVAGTDIPRKVYKHSRYRDIYRILRNTYLEVFISKYFTGHDASLESKPKSAIERLVALTAGQRTRIANSCAQCGAGSLSSGVLGRGRVKRIRSHGKDHERDRERQAEELNTIVGNAFRMAYVAQLQRQPILQDVISSRSTPSYRKDKQEHRTSWNKSLPGDDTIAAAGACRSPSSNSWLKSRTSPTSKIGRGPSAADMNVQLGSAGSPTLRLASVKAPNTIPGLRPSFTNVLGPITNVDEPKSLSQQSTPSSDESNSPTELNSYKRLTDKPPLIKRLAMGLTGGRDVLGLNGEDDSCPLVSGSSTPTSPSNRPHSGGYINEAIIDSEGTRPSYNKIPPSESLDNTINASITNVKNFNIENNRIGHNYPDSGTEAEFKSKRRSQISTSSSSVPADGSTHGSTPTPPPLPERTDSLNNRSEEAELRKAPWFQAGIPREITLEVLSQEPEGAFMVRESTSKPGCYALSLRVPREFQPSGIAHYLIMRTNKGYKIKGFTKEFTTLTALITHHSVMPELLPCPLSLSRYNPSFVKTDSSKDFADIDSDPDYNTLADFRKMMADLNV